MEQQTIVTEMRFAVKMAMLQAADSGDMELHLGDGSKFTCHRAVLCSKNEFFNKATKTDSFREGKIGIVELKQDPPNAIRCMVDFLYTDEYSISDRLNYLKTGYASKQYAEEVVAHAEVYVVSTIYGIPKLEACASRYIQIALADDRKLKKFPQLIKTLFRGAKKLDPGLGHALLEYAAKHMEALLSVKKFRSIFQISPHFVADAMRKALKMAKENQKENNPQAMGLQDSDSDESDWDSDDSDDSDEDSDSDDEDEEDSDEEDSDEEDSDEDSDEEDSDEEDSDEDSDEEDSDEYEDMDDSDEYDSDCNIPLLVPTAKDLYTYD